MNNLMDLITALANALYEISPPEIQRDIEAAMNTYRESNNE